MRFARLLEVLRADPQPGFALAELNDLLSGLTPGELGSAVEHADLAGSPHTSGTMWRPWWSWPPTSRTYRPQPGCAMSSP